MVWLGARSLFLWAVSAGLGAKVWDRVGLVESAVRGVSENLVRASFAVGCPLGQHVTLWLGSLLSWCKCPYAEEGAPALTWDSSHHDWQGRLSLLAQPREPQLSSSSHQLSLPQALSPHKRGKAVPKVHTGKSAG